MIRRDRRRPSTGCQNAPVGPTPVRSSRNPVASLAPSVGLSHVRAFVLIVVAAIAIGTVGYVVIEGWSFSDALFMTVSTLATVGFGEVRPLDEAGRAWTILLMIAGVGIIFGTIGIVAEVVVTEVSSTRREAKRMADQIAALRDHYILCGYGRVGSTVARELVHGGAAGRRHRRRAELAGPGPARRSPRRRGRCDRGRDAAPPASSTPAGSSRRSTRTP